MTKQISLVKSYYQLFEPEELKELLIRIFPGLEEYERNDNAQKNSSIIKFVWKGENIKLSLKDGKNVFTPKRFQVFIKEMIRKQSCIDSLRN